MLSFGLKAQNTGLVGRPEIPRFIKDVIGGEELFAGYNTPTVCLHQGYSIEESWMLLVWSRLHNPYQQGRLRQGMAKSLLPLIEGLALLLKMLRT